MATITKRTPKRADLIVRTTIGLIFVVAGISKWLAPEHTARLLEMRGIPDPRIVGMSFAVLEAVTGCLLVSGYRTRQIAFALALIYAPIALVFHSPLFYTWAVARSMVLDFAFDIVVIAGLWLLATGRLNERR